jgi:hypothetical protein
MSKSIRISDELLESAKEHAKRFHRSPPQQIEHWAEIGKVMEPVLSYQVESRIKITATDEAIEEALCLPGTPQGEALAHKVIARTSA